MTIGTPVVKMHLEAETDSCICARYSGCGGVIAFNAKCSEHGLNSGPMGRFHTHGLQTGRISVGTHAL